MPPPTSLKILCFGNSLTAGYHQYGLAYHPYADTLEPTLRKLVPSLTNLIVDVDGLPGDRVMSPQGRSMERMRERLLRNRATTGTKRLYDWVVVMSGTNDLGWGAKAEEVFEGLANLYTETLSLSPQSRILALNIIESAMVSGTSQSRRKDLNALIAAHKITPTPTTTTTSNDSQTSPPPPPPPPADQHDEKEQEGKFFVCDLHSAIPYHSMSKEERTEIWDDGLHLTEKGYERMGEVVGARLAEILNLGS